MMTEENVLYGGFEGTQQDLVGNATSFGEVLLQKLKDAGNSVLFVSFNDGTISAVSSISCGILLSNRLTV